jgi:hypothetical protein
MEKKSMNMSFKKKIPTQTKITSVNENVIENKIINMIRNSKIYKNKNY